MNSAQYFVKNEYSKNVTAFEGDNYNIFKYHLSIMTTKPSVMSHVSFNAFGIKIKISSEDSCF